MKNLLGELMGANGHGDRQNCGHGNRDATNEQHQEIVDPLTVWAMLDGVHDKNFNNDAYGNWNDAEITNCCKNLKKPIKSWSSCFTCPR